MNYERQPGAPSRLRPATQTTRALYTAEKTHGALRTNTRSAIPSLPRGHRQSPRFRQDARRHAPSNHDRRDSRGVESTAGRSCRPMARSATRRSRARTAAKLQPGGASSAWMLTPPSSCRRRRHDCALSGSDPKPSWHIEATLGRTPQGPRRRATPGVDMVLADLGGFVNAD